MIEQLVADYPDDHRYRDALAAGRSYPAITLTVSVTTNATQPNVTNSATVAGGGELNTSNDTANDLTTIVTPLPDLTILKEHVGPHFIQGQPGQYLLTVANGGPVASSGMITVTDTLPSGISFATGTGTGWSCSASGQLVACTDASTPIAAGGTSAITLSVNVAANAPASEDNFAQVACTCTESNTTNNTSPTDTVSVTPLAGSLFTLTPCRLLDTRSVEGYGVTAGVEQTITVRGNCGVPVAAKEVALNVTLVLPTAASAVMVYSADQTSSPAAAVAHAGPGMVRASNAIVMLSAAGKLKILLDTGSADVILDISGFFE